MEERKTLIVLDDELAPLFTDTLPCSYWQARCDYAGRQNKHLQWVLSRRMDCMYHAECYATVLMNQCKERRLTEDWTYEKILDHVQYRRGYNTHLQRFYAVDEAMNWLKHSPQIPPWCQYCMQLFW